MKISELIRQLKTLPQDFEVEFVFTDTRTQSSVDVRTIQNIEYCDTGWSDGVVTLTGDVKN